MTQKIIQSTHENGYIKPRKTFWRNSKQLLTIIKGIQSLTVSIKASFLSRILWNCPKKNAAGAVHITTLKTRLVIVCRDD